jgi:arylsulfatase
MTGLETERQRGEPGYELFLNDRVFTVARLLQREGYFTSIAGKWDQGGRNARGSLPNTRGFDRSFVLVEGLADHFRPKAGHHLLAPPSYRLDGKPVALPEDFYSSKTYADYAIQFIREAVEREQPFFSFLSFTAPHYPLQARPETVEEYRGRYDDGYPAVREARIQRMRAAGLLPSGVSAAPFHTEFPAWEELDDEFQSWEARRMETYAAMVDDMDHEFGRVIEALRRQKLLDSTLVVFLSDNGPEAGNPLDYGAGPFLAEHYDLSAAGIGAPDGFTWYGPGWAAVSAGPYRLFKHFMTHGGVLSPAIVRAPGTRSSGAVSHEFVSVMDLLPSFMDAAGATDWREWIASQGRHVPQGRSLLGNAMDTSVAVHPDDAVFAMELFNRRMLTRGNWKVVWANAPWGAGLGRWALFNIDDDPTELVDLSAREPQIQASLLRDWTAWSQSVGAIPEPEFQLPIANDDSHYRWRPPALRGTYP